MNENDIRNRAREIIAIIKNRFVRPDGLLARTYPPTDRTLFDNFDDLAPFFIYFEEQEFLLSQIRRIRELNEDIETLCAANGVLESKVCDEWLGGLYAVWKVTRNNLAFELLSESIEYINSHMIVEDFFSAAFYSRGRKTALYYEPWSAGVLELFCEVRGEFPAEFETAKRILRCWLEDDYFREFGLFPYRVFRSPSKQFIQKRILSRHVPSERHSFSPPGRKTDGLLGRIGNGMLVLKFNLKSGWYSQLMKSNSTPAFTVLELYNITGDEYWKRCLERWINSALALFCDGGQVFGEYHPAIGYRRDSGVTPAFILCDVICDSAYFIPSLRSHLPAVKNILDFYCATKLPNGLIPYLDNGVYAHIDSQMDFAVSLRRYGELSSDRRYVHESMSLTERALELHYTPEGYVTYSGNNAKQVIDPKYNALLLKGMINLLTEGESLYEGYHSLFKDR
jgi:hypothetical protein